MKKLSEFPKDWHLVRSDKRPKEAVQLLMQHLGHTRQTSYELVAEPDKRQRNRPAADFIYAGRGSGERVAVEYTEFTDPNVAEASSLMKRSRRIRKRNPNDVTPMELDREQLGFVEPVRSFPQDFVLLDRFIAGKIKKGQLQETEADERILLVYGETQIAENSLNRFRYRCGLTPAERNAVDHAFVIVEQRQVYQLW